MTIKKNRQTFFIYPWRKIHGICHRKKNGKTKWHNNNKKINRIRTVCVCWTATHQYLAWQPHYTCHRASKSVAIAFLQKVWMNFLATGRPRVTSPDQPDVFWCGHSSATGSWTAICPVCCSQDRVKLVFGNTDVWLAKISRHLLPVIGSLPYVPLFFLPPVVAFYIKPLYCCRAVA